MNNLKNVNNLNEYLCDFCFLHKQSFDGTDELLLTLFILGYLH